MSVTAAGGGLVSGGHLHVQAFFKALAASAARRLPWGFSPQG